MGNTDRRKNILCLMTRRCHCNEANDTDNLAVMDGNKCRSLRLGREETGFDESDFLNVEGEQSQ